VDDGIGLVHVIRGIELQVGVGSTEDAEAVMCRGVEGEGEFNAYLGW
jgi:hypothetical protein